MERSRFLLWAAIVSTSAVCALIVAHYSTRKTQKTIDLSAYLNPPPSSSPELEPPLQPKLNATFPDATMPISKDTPSFTHSQAQAPKAEMTSQQSKENTLSDDSAKRVLPPARLASDDFPYQNLPFDAPVAEFPLVLVWQKQLELDQIREMSGSSADPMLDMRNNIYRVPGNPPGPPPGPPPHPPGPKPPKPPVESNAGL